MTQATPATAVVTLGECMASFIARERGSMAASTDFLRTIAGAEANVAVGLARLGVTVSYVGRVGDDPLGTTIVRTLRGEGVDVRHLRVDAAAATGVMIRELRDLGPAEVIYWRDGSAGSRLSVDDVAAADARFEGAAWLHVTGITPALSASAASAVHAAIQRARTGGLTISLDVNFRRRLWSEAEARHALLPLVGTCDIVLGGLDELAVMAGFSDSPDDVGSPDPARVADALLAQGAGVVVVKLGPGGAFERRRGHDGITSAAAPGVMVSHVVDPVGAGDAFCAGYIAASLAGGPPVGALAAANACGASVASSLGDQAGLPTRVELDRLLASGGLDTLR